MTLPAVSQRPLGSAKPDEDGSARGGPSASLAVVRTLVLVAAIVTAGGVLFSGVLPTAAASSTPSAIGPESPSWIQVAPNYQRTGLVIAVSTPTSGCSSDCVHLWVSHDGGATWSRAAAKGWDGGRPVIAVDSRGHNVLFSGTSAGLSRSDDGGNTWVAVGPSGTPTISPSYAHDGGSVAVAVPGGQDYILKDSGRTDIPGSGSSMIDMTYAYAPSFPSGGKYSPVLLTGEDKSQRLPVIQQCSGAYSCSGAATLAGAVYFSSPVTLLPSTTYGSDGVVFAQSGRGIYKSTNGGAAFTAIPLGDPTATATATPMLALAPGYSEQSSNRTAWAAVFQVFQDKSNPKASHAGGGIFRTDDGGTTWQAVGTRGPFDGGAMAVAVGADGRLFGGYVGGTSGMAGLLCSTDRGTTWSQACPAEGRAANDPGVVTGSFKTCTTCTPGPTPRPTTVSSSPSGGGAPAPSASALAGGNLGHDSGPSQPLGSTGAHAPTPSRPWGPVAAVLAGLLLVAAGLSTLRQRRRRRSALAEVEAAE